MDIKDSQNNQGYNDDLNQTGVTNTNVSNVVNDDELSLKHVAILSLIGLAIVLFIFDDTFASLIRAKGPANRPPPQLEVIVNNDPVVLSGDEVMTISFADYTMHNDITLRDNAVLIIEDSVFDYTHDYSFQYWLRAYDNSQVIVKDSTITSDPWLNWEFWGNSSLSMSNIINDESGIWHGFNDNPQATVNNVSVFRGTMSKNTIFNIQNIGETFIEIVFEPNAVVDETFPSIVDKKPYSFPNNGETGINTNLSLRKVDFARWGITYVPEDDITIKDTDSIVVTFNIPYFTVV